MKNIMVPHETGEQTRFSKKESDGELKPGHLNRVTVFSVHNDTCCSFMLSHSDAQILMKIFSSVPNTNHDNLKQHQEIKT